jgi:hypothetical protein
MKKMGDQHYEMWSNRDGFFYDVLTFPDGKFAKFRVRSLVGIIPLYAMEYLEEEQLLLFPEFKKNFDWFLKNRKDLVENSIIVLERGKKKRHVLTVMNEEQLRSVLQYIWDPEEFRSEFGLRSLSKFHEKNPFVFEDKQVGYEPAESHYKVKGGNSNWRGPIWIPTTFLLIGSLNKLAHAFHHDIEIKVANEAPIDLETMARSFSERILALFKKDKAGNRPFLGTEFPFHKDPHWDHILFYEYFNPETGKGLGASHQSGWSALVANLIDQLRR